MSTWGYIAGCTSAATVTTVELAFRNQRHPFGDRKLKAVGWWLAVVLLDASVGLLMLAGAASIDLIDASAADSRSQLWQGIAVGVLGPLALRSPVRRTEVHQQESQVGVTYVYDLARLRAVYALDERFVRLRRRDVETTRLRWRQRGLDSNLIAAAIRRHLDDHQRLPADQRDRVASAVANSLTLPTEDQCMTALIKLMRQERFASLIDEMDSFSVSAETESLPSASDPPPSDEVEVVEDDVAAS